MVPPIVHTLFSILSRFGSQFHKYHFLCCKRVGRQSIRHPLNSDISIRKFTGIKELDLFLCLILDTYIHRHFWTLFNIFTERQSESGVEIGQTERSAQKKNRCESPQKIIKDSLEHFKTSLLDFVRRHHIITETSLL